MPERHRPPSPDQLRAHLTERRARLADLEARGIDALSRYDIEIAHGGNAEQALATARWLVSNHIRSYERQLTSSGTHLRQADFFAQQQPTVTDVPHVEAQDEPPITTT